MPLPYRSVRLDAGRGFAAALIVALLAGAAGCRDDASPEDPEAVSAGPRRDLEPPTPPAEDGEGAAAEREGPDTTALAVPGGDTIPAQAPGADSLLALVSESPARGPADAAVVLVEFSDFECPFCGRARETIDRFMRDRPDARLVYVHYPIPSLHPRAVLAAEAAVEAQRQGKFWEYHDALFERGPPLDRAALIEVAEEVGLDAAAMRRALQSRAHRERVEREMELGESLDVTGTPTFFVNGYRLVGAQPYETFVTVYNLLLRATRRDELASAGEGAPR